jgi:hypothetical protein
MYIDRPCSGSAQRDRPYVSRASVWPSMLTSWLNTYVSCASVWPSMLTSWLATYSAGACVVKVACNGRRSSIFMMKNQTFWANAGCQLNWAAQADNLVGRDHAWSLLSHPIRSGPARLHVSFGLLQCLTLLPHWSWSTDAKRKESFRRHEFLNVNRCIFTK